MGWFMKNPVIRAVIFAIMTAFFGFASVKLWYEDYSTPDDPEPMPFQEAIERSKNDRLWVALQNVEDLRWDCSSIVHWSVDETNSEWMDVVVTNPTQSVIMVVVLPDPLTCDQLLAMQPALTGELSHLSGRDYKDSDFEGRLSKYTQATTVLNLCTYCDPNKSEPVIVISLVGMVVSLIIAIFAFYKVFSGGS
jgi:hypothetical protein